MTAAGTTGVYYRTEKVRLISEHGLDYLIEDVNTGQQYLIDKSAFKKRYIEENELIPVHTELWDKLQNQALQLHQLKRANSRLKEDVRSLRRAAEEERKNQREKQHYRNGQKRGRTRNG